MTEITFPKSLQAIKWSSFENCTGLTSYLVASDNPYFTSLNGLLCNKDGTVLIRCPYGLATVTIPESITAIEKSAFVCCSNLTVIDLPSSVTTIGDGAFASCSSLKNIRIPDDVATIGNDAFNWCTNLTSIDLPESITKINDYTFYGCRSLTTINLPGVVHIKTGAFQYCTNLKTVNMPKVILIEAWTFSSCSSLKNIIIPESTTFIDFRAFIYTELTTVKFTSSTTPISDDSRTVPQTATIIGYDPSTAKEYANKYNRKFKLIGERAELESIAITSPAQKLNYTISEPLDLNGLVVTGTYSDGSTKAEAINEQNIAGFDSTKVAEKQLLTITINGKTTTYTIQVGASDTGINCLYQTHVQDVGWQNWKSNGGMSGTEGRSLRLEGIAINLDKAGYDLGISYQTHIQDIGWEAATPSGWKSNGLMSGTEGRSLRLEAIQIKLTGTDADHFDIYYQVHAENIGWMGWAKNGESAGTAGFSYRLEGIRIKVVPKDAPAPGVTDKPFEQK